MKSTYSVTNAAILGVGISYTMNYTQIIYRAITCNTDINHVAVQIYIGILVTSQQYQHAKTVATVELYII